MQQAWMIWLAVLAMGCGANVDTHTRNNSSDGPPPPPLRVTSFNIRHSRAKDGPNHWTLRRDVFFETLKRAQPDLLGLQEVLADQAAEIRAAMPGHDFVGVGRNDAKEDGEFSPILFRRERFEKLDSGHFWLSQTPETIGSRGWDANIPRLVTWVKLRDRLANDRRFLFVNTHWDHMGQVARLESARLMRQRLAPDLPVIVTGDFNCTEDDPPYAALLHGQTQPQLLDSFREVHPTRTREEATFNGFDGRSTGSRIDWILHTPHFTASAASIDRFNVDGRYPSDHFPVHAQLNWARP
jgi:endonuclease/exonuclease/phosphatase family metal-dependent hydrolase